ncbi:MAG TPA: envelope biogenesis factor ElyC [Deltaproteobacteria bacterium]|nr:envelope biogenesis factor ElyC [Deltaproteobacteria bacterium]
MAIGKSLIHLIFPLPLCLELTTVGLVLLWFTKRQFLGRVFVTAGLVLLLAFSSQYISGALLAPFEYEYPPGGLEEGTSLSDGTVDIVVLGAGYLEDEGLPLTGRLGDAALIRTVEGVRLYKRLGRARLILSGGSFSETKPSELMARLAVELDVAADDLIVEKQSLNTHEEAVLLKPLLEDRRFLLVTSASHMPRAMALFRAQGLDPVAVPTGHLVSRERSVGLPSAKGVEMAERAFYEYFGLLKERLMGHI